MEEPIPKVGARRGKVFSSGGIRQLEGEFAVLEVNLVTFGVLLRISLAKDGYNSIGSHIRPRLDPRLEGEVLSWSNVEAGRPGGGNAVVDSIEAKAFSHFSRRIGRAVLETERVAAEVVLHRSLARPPADDPRGTRGANRRIHSHRDGHTGERPDLVRNGNPIVSRI